MSTVVDLAAWRRDQDFSPSFAVHSLGGRRGPHETVRFQGYVRGRRRAYDLLSRVTRRANEGMDAQIRAVVPFRGATVPAVAHTPFQVQMQEKPHLGEDVRAVVADMTRAAAEALAAEAIALGLREVLVDDED